MQKSDFELNPVNRFFPEREVDRLKGFVTRDGKFRQLMKRTEDRIHERGCAYENISFTLLKSSMI